MQTLGEYIADLRASKGLSQKELARKAGISQATVQKIEVGATLNPGIDVLISIAKALKTSVFELILVYQGKSPNLKGVVDQDAIRQALYKSIDTILEEHFQSK